MTYTSTSSLERAEKSALFQPISLGALRIKHRIALAPLTRNRGKASEAVKGTWYPWKIHEEYYTQRATDGGLLISEALPISLQAIGTSMVGEPGIWTSEQVQGWKAVTTATRAKGAVFIAQREY
jgi:2,4-dienoyl-CoA reductase-like NADH-dependent reductase (Old Yellow Enzyme family)